MKKLLFLSITAILSLSFFSCGDEDDPDTKRFYLDVKDVKIEATEYNKWHYFSFSKGEVVGVGNADLATDAEWAARTDWDIAFTTLYVRLNCGTSSSTSALGGGFETGATTTSGTQDKLIVFNYTTVAPNVTYTKDSKAAAKTPLVIGRDPEVTYLGSYNNVVSAWISFNNNVSNGGDYLSSRKAFVLKTADGKYVKMLLKSFHEGRSGLEAIQYVKDPETGENTEEIVPITAQKGVITFSYAYQPDGSGALMTERP